MNVKQITIILFLIIVSFSGFCQDKFQILKSSSKSSITFKLVNNLIVIPVYVNGEELFFLFDTGIDKTLLFNVASSTSLNLRGVQKIRLRGLGEGEVIEAIVSKNNELKVGNVIGNNQVIYVLEESQLSLTAKLGIDINGIIGGDLIEDFVVKVNYSANKITFYDPVRYQYQKCKGCETFPLEFFKGKPLLTVTVENHVKEEFKVNLLIDSGGSDAIWLFETTNSNIVVPQNSFKDLLGEGLGGNILGKRSILKRLNIGPFEFKNVSVAYPDSTSIVSVQDNRKRNGTLGSEILRRFHVIYDYSNQKITLKKNASNYKDIFSYNKSGIELVYGGEMLVRERRPVFTNQDSNSQQENSITQIIYTYGLAYKPSYQIAYIREGSSAEAAGLKVGDVILEINHRVAYNYKMEEIIYMLSGRKEKKIRLSIDRDGKPIKFVFYLEDLL